MSRPLYGNTIEVLTVVSLMYFIPCYLLSLVAGYLERGPDQRAGQDVLLAVAPERATGRAV